MPIQPYEGYDQFNESSRASVAVVYCMYSLFFSLNWDCHLWAKQLFHFCGKQTISNTYAFDMLEHHILSASQQKRQNVWEVYWIIQKVLLNCSICAQCEKNIWNAWRKWLKILPQWSLSYCANLPITLLNEIISLSQLLVPFGDKHIQSFLSVETSVSLSVCMLCKLSTITRMLYVLFMGITE